MKRIFWVEPNLIYNSGHVIESVTAVKAYLEGCQGTELVIVTNKRVVPEVRRLLEGIYPIVEHGCFEELEDGGKSFYRDMEKINRLFNFKGDDLIVIPTSYSNQFLGISQFLSHHPTIKNKVVLQIHQFLPPAPIFEETLKEAYTNKYKLLLSDALGSLCSYSGQVFVGSTESGGLNQCLNTLSGLKIEKLPLPINFHQKLLSSQKKNAKTVAFLGDGRCEKGLLLFLEVIKQWPVGYANLIVQDLNFRGYTLTETARYLRLKTEITKKFPTSFIEGTIKPYDFQVYIATSDIVVFPYHPQNYDKRVSEIYIMSVMYHKACLVSSGTWMAEQAVRYGTGEVFSYNLSNENETIRNLGQSLSLLVSKNCQVTKEMKNQARTYRRFNSPDNFVKILLSL